MHNFRGLRPAKRKFPQFTTPEHNHRMKPEADAALKNVFARIGKPKEGIFVPDDFQVAAIEAIRKTDCLVTAPTGSGKTWIAEQAIQNVYSQGGRSWYASPLKALSNAKWVEFSSRFAGANVGILTGDTKENADAPIIVGTTEILRNQLYDAMHQGENLDCDLVILDEAHYLGDRDRGVVWEEIMIYLPARINLLLLSATIGNAGEIAGWLSSIRGKECVVITESRRPVPLYPLFLDPSRRIMPYLEKQKKLFSGVTAYISDRQRKGERHGRPPHFGDIIRTLERFDLLPAIFFLKSRAECDAAVRSCRDRCELSANGGFEDDLEELVSRFPFLRGHKQLPAIKFARVASHHAGQLPAWKFFVETMMKKGHLRAIFATTTVAAGVNYPARTIVLFNSDTFNGHEFSPLNGTEFHQMTGRAGRRGQDRIGFMVAVPGRFMDIIHVKRLLFRSAEEIDSRIRNDFSMVLNLLLSHDPEDIKDIFDKSFAAWQHKYHGSKHPEKVELWDDFRRHLDFLKAEGFADPSNRLTGKGVWTSKLRLDQPLLIAECLMHNALPGTDEKLLAAAVAPFIYDGDQDMKLTDRYYSKKLIKALHEVTSCLKPLIRRMNAAGFPVNQLYLWTAKVVHDWAKGDEWGEIVQAYNMGEGDLAMLILRTADNLRQIASLKDSHPAIAAMALKAIDVILREPVVFDYN